MHLRATPLTLRSFDGTERTRGSRVRPERRRDLEDAVRGDAPFIARGAGLSYCAASMGEGVVSVDMLRLDRVLGFEPQTGEITVEPGLGIGALTELLAARGRWLPPLPGYPSISVGGCVAFDVHGKSQLHSGNFGDWVTELALLHPAHGEIECSRTRHAELFELTVGGLGLTGLITRVTLKTAPLPARSLELQSLELPDLYQAPALMRERAPGVDALYSWHNLAPLRRRGFGPGILFVERFVAEPHERGNAEAGRSGPRLSLQARAPLGLWSRPFAALALGGYRALQRPGGKRVLPLRRALFPIEGLEVYYFAFGARGLREYQLIVPDASWGPFLDALRPLLDRVRFPVTLASLKLFAGAGRNLSFGGAGVCLALDVPCAPGSADFFAALDQLAQRHGASVNVAKDSRIGAGACRRLFAGYDAYAAALRAYDPDRRCQSRLRERLGV